MSFEVRAEAYGRFMGRYSEPLAREFLQLAGVGTEGTALDVGCGTGALTAPLVELLGAGAVAAADPSEAFVAAAQERFPQVEVRRAAAEALPYASGQFDFVLAQLVVHFMTDPVAGLREMARVARPGGRVAACVWDHAGGRSPISTFWQAAVSLDAQARDESRLNGAREGHLAALFETAGLDDVKSTGLAVSSRFSGFEEWWEPMTLGVGPVGEYMAGRSVDEIAALRARCAELLPAEGPFEITAVAWAATGLGRS